MNLKKWRKQTQSGIKFYNMWWKEFKIRNSLTEISKIFDFPRILLFEIFAQVLLKIPQTKEKFMGSVFPDLSKRSQGRGESCFIIQACRQKGSNNDNLWEGLETQLRFMVNHLLFTQPNLLTGLGWPLYDWEFFLTFLDVGRILKLESIWCCWEKMKEGDGRSN